MPSPILAIAHIAPTQTDKTTTMNDMVDTLEAALQDQLAVSFAAGNVTLTALQYTRHLCFVGSGAAVARVMTVPLTKRLFAVRNLNSDTLTIGGTTGATVVLAASSAAIILCDGTDCTVFGSGGPGPTGPSGTFTATNFAAMDLSTLPTTDPGSGKPWLNGGVLQVGA